MIRTPRSRLPGRRSPCRYRDAGPSGVFEDMLTGWKQQQLARNFTAGTIRRRESLVRRFVDHTGHCPWDWTVGDADEFFAHEGSILNLAFATIRDYQTHLKVFRDFLTDPVYEWDRACLQGFGRSPAQIITEFNQARHSQDNKQGPTKRFFTRAVLQGSFDPADLEVERVVASGRKGAAAAYRDATPGSGTDCPGWPRPCQKSSPPPTDCRCPSPTCTAASATTSTNSVIRRSWTFIRCDGPMPPTSSSTSASTTPSSSGRSATNTPRESTAPLEPHLAGSSPNEHASLHWPDEAG